MPLDRRHRRSLPPTMSEEEKKKKKDYNMHFPGVKTRKCKPHPASSIISARSLGIDVQCQLVWRVHEVAVLSAVTSRDRPNLVNEIGREIQSALLGTDAPFVVAAMPRAPRAGGLSRRAVPGGVSAAPEEDAVCDVKGIAPLPTGRRDALAHCPSDGRRSIDLGVP